MNANTQSDTEKEYREIPEIVHHKKKSYVVINRKHQGSLLFNPLGVQDLARQQNPVFQTLAGS